jgi:hypothetical protein
MRRPRLCGVRGDDVFAAAVLRRVLLDIILGSADAVQHREKLVRFPKASWFEHRRRGRSESFKLFGWVSSQVDLGALEAGMAEPERDLADVPCRLEGVLNRPRQPLSRGFDPDRCQRP